MRNNYYNNINSDNKYYKKCYFYNYSSYYY